MLAAWVSTAANAATITMEPEEFTSQEGGDFTAKFLSGDTANLILQFSLRHLGSQGLVQWELDFPGVRVLHAEVAQSYLTVGVEESKVTVSLGCIGCSVLLHPFTTLGPLEIDLAAVPTHVLYRFGVDHEFSSVARADFLVPEPSAIRGLPLVLLLAMRVRRSKRARGITPSWFRMSFTLLTLFGLLPQRRRAWPLFRPQSATQRPGTHRRFERRSAVRSTRVGARRAWETT